VFHNEDHALTFFNNLNNTPNQPNLQFTMESEINGSINFLDIHIQKTHNNIETSVFRKTTHSLRTISPHSDAPRSLIRNIVNTLRTRAHVLCNTTESLGKELIFIEDQFVKNGHKRPFIHGLLNPPLDRPRNKPEEDNKVFVCLPFCRTSAKLKPYLEHHDFKVRFCKNSTTGHKLYHNKPPTQLLQKNNVVYKAYCGTDGCEAEYVGKTTRRLITRLKEHQKAADQKDIDHSALAKHLAINNHQLLDKKHRLVGEPPQILDTDNKNNRLLVKETLAILRNQPALLPQLGASYQISNRWDALL
jgi:hypothetical protein